MLAIKDPPPAEVPVPKMIGTIEGLGQLSDRELLVTGWSRDEIAAGAPVLVLAGSRGVEGRFWPVWSDRPDVGPRAAFAGLIETASPVVSDKVNGLGFANARALTLYRDATRFDPAQSAGVLRGVLANAADAETRRRLMRAAARYDGTDTIAAASLPVRLGIDDCVALPAGMLLVTGWLFDPERLVSTVSVAGSSGERRIDDGWIGQARPDVTQSFADDPRLGGYVHATDVHGFSAIVAQAADDRAHITLSFSDHPALHCPLVPRRGHPLGLLRKLLRALDPLAPGSLDIVDRQIAPALAAVSLPDPMPAGDVPQVQGPLSIVVGCHGDCAEIPALLTIFGAKPGMAQVPVIVAAGEREMSAHAGQIERAARMVGLSVTIVAGRNIEDRFDAVSAGLAASETEHVCLMTGSLVPETVNWLSLLLAARSDGSVVLPAIETVDGKPWAGGECCLIRRANLLDAGGFSGVFLDPVSKSEALLSRLAAAGVARVDAEVTMTMAAGAMEAWQALARRADAAAAALRIKAGPHR